MPGAINSDLARPQFSKLAGTAIILAPLLAIGTVGITLFLITGIFKSGWSGSGHLYAILAHLVLFGGSLTSATAIASGFVARRQIGKQPDKLCGRRQAGLAVIIGAFSLLGVWGIIGSVVAVRAIRQAPHRAAEADIRATFQAVVSYSVENDTFPDTLDQVVSPETAGRYIYLGKGLPSKFAGYQAEGEGSQSIVVMYAVQSVDGKFAAICADGMTHEWTKRVLEGALRNSGMLRDYR